MRAAKTAGFPSLLLQHYGSASAATARSSVFVAVRDRQLHADLGEPFCQPTAQRAGSCGIHWTVKKESAFIPNPNFIRSDSQVHHGRGPWDSL